MGSERRWARYSVGVAGSVTVLRWPRPALWPQVRCDPTHYCLRERPLLPVAARRALQVHDTLVAFTGNVRPSHLVAALWTVHGAGPRFAHLSRHGSLPSGPVSTHHPFAA